MASSLVRTNPLKTAWANFSMANPLYRQGLWCLRVSSEPIAMLSWKSDHPNVTTAHAQYRPVVIGDDLYGVQMYEMVCWPTHRSAFEIGPQF